jgi:hypothetical protein
MTLIDFEDFYEEAVFESYHIRDISVDSQHLLQVVGVVSE